MCNFNNHLLYSRDAHNSVLKQCVKQRNGQWYVKIKALLKVAVISSIHWDWTAMWKCTSTMLLIWQTSLNITTDAYCCCTRKRKTVLCYNVKFVFYCNIFFLTIIRYFLHYDGIQTYHITRDFSCHNSILIIVLLQHEMFDVIWCELAVILTHKMFCVITS